MKIITWNCNMAYRKKTDAILIHQPDILIVPECESLGKLKFDKDILIPSDILWHGTNLNKGLAIFSFGEYKLKYLTFIIRA